MPDGENKIFRLELVDQDWLGTEPAQFDLCSHGRIFLQVDGQVISDARETYGASESALALLRTLERNHSADLPLAERLIFHGCGNVLMMGCPIGIDWRVQYEENDVVISEIKRWDTPEETRPTQFPGLEVRIPISLYRQEIVNFARQVREFFMDQEKVFFNTEEQLAYENFWLEFNERLERQERLLENN